MTPYYQDDLVTIYHGDCREWMPEADVIVTDPPYGIAVVQGGTIGGSNRGVASQYAPVYGDDQPFDPAPILALGKPTVLFGANHYADRLPPTPSWIVWDKKLGGASDSFADAELAWTNLGGPVRVFRQLWRGMIRNAEPDEDRVHPTQKPLSLMRWVLGRTSGSVLDPYMGSGTTLVAAKDLGRRAIGIEIEERYCEIAAKRCSQEVLGLSA